MTAWLGYAHKAIRAWALSWLALVLMAAWRGPPTWAEHGAAFLLAVLLGAAVYQAPNTPRPPST